MIESDAAMTEDLVAYNIIPLDAPTMTNVITSFAEVSSFILLVIEYSYSHMLTQLVCRYKQQFLL